MRTTLNILTLMVLSLFGVAQSTPGALITPNYAVPPATYLNPNGDSWVTTSGGPYISNDHDESELAWTSIPQVDSEPSGDLNSGGPCGTTDIMDDPSTGADASYVLFIDPNGILGDGDEYMVYRLRIARDPGSGNFGFSVLMDIDEKFGTADPDSVEGNPGFEIEVRVKNGGGSKALYLDSVNGTTSGTNKESYSLAFYTQRSYALNQNASCTGKAAVFYDFIIPFADLTTHFGMDVNTPIRLVGATSQNGGSVLGSAASDIAGIDDDNYANSVAGQDQAFRDFVNNQTPARPSDATGFGVLPVELGFFNGQATSKGNVLDWRTYSEISNEKFVIERSANGVDFHYVGEVSGAGNSSMSNNYTYTDYTNAPNAYYRLKQVDFDGKFEYSKVINVENAQSNSLQLNFNNEQLFIEGEYNWIEVNVVSMRGEVVMHMNLEQGEYSELANLSKGVYIVSYLTDTGNFGSQKIVIQ